MKKIISSLLMIGSFLPAAAFAASVQVMPIIENAHGGTADYRALNSCVTQNGSTQCEAGIPTFSLGEGAYSVSVTNPAGYTSALGATCNGTLQADSSVVCYVEYKDGAPIVAPAPVVPAPPSFQPVVEPISGINTPAVPDDVTLGSLTEAEQIAALQAQILELYRILIDLLQKRLATLLPQE